MIHSIIMQVLQTIPTKPPKHFLGGKTKRQFARPRNRTKYEYDDLGRLQKVEADDGTTIEYDLDDVGNRETVTTTLPAANDPPIASNDSVSVYRYYTVLKNVVANDSDPNSDTLTITSVTQPWNGNVTIWTSTTLRVYGSAVGTSSFTYTISDGNGGTDTGTVFLQVTASGPPPP